MRTFLASVVIFLILGLRPGDGARILGIFPIPSISHQGVFRGLTLALNQRGHELVVLTPNVINHPSLTNYKEIDLGFLHDNIPPFNFFDIRRNSSHMDHIYRFHEEMNRFTEMIYELPEFREIYSHESNETFDLLMVELLLVSSFSPLAARFNVPIIGVTTLGLTTADRFAIGLPVLSSHPSNYIVKRTTGDQLSFKQRLDNFVQTWLYVKNIETNVQVRRHEIVKKYLGNDIPYVGDVWKNISLVFTTQLSPLWHVTPTLPNVIEIDGFQLSRQDLTLSEDFKKFLDDATEGFVYMSLGTNVQSTGMPVSTRKNFMDVFSKLPQKVLWKYDDDLLPGKPENVFIAKWFPQQAVLAHPNIKAFIYQGGSQSTEEAVHFAVPLIGIPIYGDQDSQVKKMVSLGVARSLEINNLTREDLEEAVLDVINNKSYKEKMLQLRSLVFDRPYDLLENAMWWIEFVIRRKGSLHLRCSISDDPWYQRYDIDIVVFISVVSFTTTILSSIIVYKIIKFSSSLFKSPVAKRKQKTL